MQFPGIEISGTTTWLPNQVNDGLPFEIVGRPPDKRTVRLAMDECFAGLPEHVQDSDSARS